MMKPLKLFSILILAVFLLTACQTGEPTPAEIPAYPAPAYPAPAYPAPGGEPYGPPTAVSAYPAPATQPSGDIVYPSPAELTAAAPTIDPNSVPFRIDKPVREGDTRVTGSGPAGVPIILADVTFYGEVIMEGQIGADGKFVFDLPKPLEKGHRIGIALGVLEGTQWKQTDFTNQGYFGSEFQAVPMVGFFYDTFMVAEK